MFLVCLAIFLPVSIVYLGILLAVVLHAAIPIFGSLSHDAPAVEAGAHIRAFFTVLLSVWFIILPVLVIFSTLVYGLAAGAMAFSYRALVPPEISPSV